MFEGYKPEKNKLRKIFDSNSEYNKRLQEYLDRCKKIKPDVEKELEKLGFNKKLTVKYPDYCTPGFVDFYTNDKEDVVSIGVEEIMVVTFNDKAKSFKSGIVGEKDRLAIEWIKESMKGEF